MRKRVLLLHCPGDKIYLHDYYTSYSSKANYYWPPSDLIILSGVLREFELTVIDAIAEKLRPFECMKKIIDLKPDAIIFTTGSATWDNDIRFINEVRQRHSCLILGSSSMFLFEARYFLEKAPSVDALILDLISSEIVEFIQGRKKAYQTIAYRNKGIFIPTPDLKRGQNFSIPVPHHELFNFRQNKSPLAKRKPFSLVITSLGCPYTCSFCVAGSIPYRYRNIDNVIEELKYLKSLGIREIMFNDPTFTVSKKRVFELCQKMKENGLDFTWVCNAHAATVSEDLVKTMKMAGCHTMMIGVESSQEEILKKYSKGATKDQIKRAFQICQKYKIRTLAYFIIGLPGETKQSVLETIKLAKELDCDYASFTVPTPDIGSRMRQEAIEKGWLDEKIKIFDSTCFPVFCSAELTKEEIWKLRQRAFREFYLRPAYLLKKITSLRSLKEFFFFLDQALAMFLR
jgi:radical SAM superfamily enzyme YgiQ (UPF0313 family)